MKIPKFKIREKIIELERNIVTAENREVYVLTKSSGSREVFLRESDARADAHREALYTARKLEKEYYEHNLVSTPKIEFPFVMWSPGYHQPNQHKRRLVFRFLKNASEARAFELSHKSTRSRACQRRNDRLSKSFTNNSIMMYYLDDSDRAYRPANGGPYKVPHMTVESVERTINLAILGLDSDASIIKPSDEEGTHAHLSNKGKNPEEIPAGLSRNDFVPETLFRDLNGKYPGSRLAFRFTPPARTLMDAWLKSVSAMVPKPKAPKVRAVAEELALESEEGLHT
jgi:hypothetical protein